MQADAISTAAIIGKSQKGPVPGTTNYFKRLGIRFKVSLLLAFLVPMAILSLYFNFQFTYTLKESAKLNLTAISESQRNTVDLLLQERVINIFSQFQTEAFNLKPTQQTMDNYLHNLRQVSDAFIDVGFLNSQGIQTGYAGPFPYLQNKNYANENWFSSLIQKDRNHYISDIYLGFRKKPHFTIAVKQIIDGSPYVMRSTLDPDKFYMFLRTINHAKGVESALINQELVYQIVDPDHGQLFVQSDLQPSVMTGTGVQEIQNKDGSILVAFAWLKMTPWALVVEEPLNIAHEKMYQARRIMIVGIVLIAVVVILVIWTTTGSLVRRARSSAENRDELQVQLLHAAKLASVGELATGIAHEINNPLAIIMATTGVIKDMLNPEFDMHAETEDILKELDTVDAAVFRAREITRKLLDYGRKHQPRLVPCNINQLLDEIIDGFKRRELAVKNIEISRRYEPELPEIILDPDQIRQVFLNFINNADDAIEGSGMITLSTYSEGGFIHVTITDTGHGMTSGQLEKIFDPFFTTKEVGKGTGLGLSVSLSIVKSMDGTINVQSIPEVGSSFTISLPLQPAERTNHDSKSEKDNGRP